MYTHSGWGHEDTFTDFFVILLRVAICETFHYFFRTFAGVNIFFNIGIICMIEFELTCHWNNKKKWCYIWASLSNLFIIEKKNLRGWKAKYFFTSFSFLWTVRRWRSNFWVRPLQYLQQYFFGPAFDVGTNILLLSHPRLRSISVMYFWILF